MNIDLVTLLESESIPDAALENAIALLEASLPIFRRDLAYTLANIRRVEQKLKQVRQELQNREQAIIGAKLAPEHLSPLEKDLQLIRQVGAELKQEYGNLARKAEELKAQITYTEQQVALGQERLKTQKARVQLAKRRKYYYMALGAIDSTFVVNVIEYPVYQEAMKQHADLSVDVRVKFKPIEIAAFALNRLPSAYAATLAEYHQQLNIINNELKPKITEAVKRGIKTLRMGDPLYDSLPLPDQLFCEPAGLLGCLSIAFNRKDLRWSDVPGLLQKIKERRSPQNQISTTSYVKPSGSTYAQRYLQRSKFRQTDRAGATTQNKVEEQFLEFYTLRGKLKYVNVMEKMVVVQALSLAIDINGNPNYAIVLAQTLNRFPPMYTTSERGLNQLCKIFFDSHAKKVSQKFLQNFETLRPLLKQNHEYLVFQKFKQEYKEAMPEIMKILNRSDLTPENLVDVITEFVNQPS